MYIHRRKVHVRKDLIEKELSYDISNGYEFKKMNLSNKFIDKLLNRYYCHEMVENFYDSEPSYDDNTFDMYMDYCDLEPLDEEDCFDASGNDKLMKNTYSDFPHTRKELFDAYKIVEQQRKDYEPRRMVFCNWQEPFFEGNWGQSQHKIDNIARDTLKEIKKFNFSNKDRLYVSWDSEEIRIYFYGRDIVGTDYWFIFLRRNKRQK